MQQLQSQPGLTLAEIRKLNPCVDRMEALILCLEDIEHRRITAAQAVEAGVPFADLVWIARAAARHDKDIERRLRLWMADCAARVLHIYEKHVPDDNRVRTAIETARQYARGEANTTAWAAARNVAMDAARDTAWEAARDAAKSATKSVARDAAWSAAWAVGWNAARDAEEKWQFDHLVARLSNPEPADWPLD